MLANIRWPWLIITLIVFSSLVKLGVWQSARADEKERRLAHIAELSSQQALSLAQVLAIQQQDPLGINDLPISISGTFYDQQVFLLDNQTNQGALGYRVLQVLTMGPQAVLVNFGWVQGSIDRQVLPEVSGLAGEYQFTGHVRILERGILLQEQNLQKNQWPLRVQQIELDKFSQLINQPLLPFVVYLDKKETIGFAKNWQPIVMPPEKHRAYAFQWFSLAIAWLVLMIWAAAKQKNNNKAF